MKNINKISKKIMLAISLIFILSCEDKTTQEFGSLDINFQTNTGEIANSNSRSASQLNDYSSARITINGISDTIQVSGSNAYYTKNDIEVGTVTVNVELLSNNEIRYSSSTSVQIQADDVTSVTLSSWYVQNQQIVFTSSLDSSYDVGNDIVLSWSNTHSEKPVSIYYLALINGAWTEYSYIDDFVGNSYTWNTSNVPVGPGKFRISSDISSGVSVESSTFQMNNSSANVENLTYNDLQWYNNTSYIVSWDKMRLTWDYAGNSAQTEYDTYICDDNDQCLLADTSTGTLNSNGQLEKIIDLDWIEYIKGDWTGSNPRRMKVCLSGTDNCSTSAEFNMYYFTASGQWTVGTAPALNQGQSIFLGHLQSQVNSLSVTTSGGDGDIDVFIYKIENPLTSNATITLVADSQNSGNSESASVSTSGYYYVEIFGYSASSNYGMNLSYTRSSDEKVINYSNEEEIQKISFD